MTETIQVPIWLALLAGLLAAWAVLDRLLVPSVRWFLRRRVHRVLEEVNARLRIPVPPFNLTKRQVMLDRLVYDPQVMAAVEALARSESTPRQVVMERVARYAHEIVPAFNAYAYFRFGAWLGRRAASTLYRVRLGPLPEADRRVPPGTTVVVVMNHRSNMDYLLVSYLAAERMALSYAVGEWARIWPLESLIRSMGAYFVRRRSGNELYRIVLRRYIQMATAEGVTQAVFPEGRLSRDGRLQEARPGILDYMLRDFDPAGSRDVLFVPVGLNYDRVLEDRTLLLDIDAGRARKRGLAAFAATLRFLGSNLLLALTGRWHRFGYACANVGEPLSARGWMTQRGLDLRGLGNEERRARISELGANLMRRVGEAVPATPVSLVAEALIEDPGRSWSLLELKGRVAQRVDSLRTRGAHVQVPRQDWDYAIAVGLRMLTRRRAVGESEGLYRVVPDELPLLRYYANSIAQL